jgi:single-strand DNA-binding protein
MSSSGSLNRVTLIGNLGSDPEIRSLPEGGRVASLSIATSDKWTDKDSGSKKEKVEWHRISIFSEPLIDLAEKYLRKGSKVYIEGSLQTRKWDDNGTTRYSTEVVLRPYRGEITMLDGPKKEPEPAPEPPKQNARSFGRKSSPQPRPSA